MKTLKSNISDLAWTAMDHENKIVHQRKDLTREMTNNKMVASYYEISPGKVNWPFHYHLANDECFFILEGEGELRTIDGKEKVKAGDFIYFPAGENGLHQLRNISESKVLRYIDIGTTRQPDVVVMPDSNKLGVFGGSAPGQNLEKRTMRSYFKLDQQTEYLKDE